MDFDKKQNMSRPSKRNVSLDGRPAESASSMCGSAATKNMPAEFVYIPRHLLNDRSVVEKAIRSQEVTKRERNVE